ncbi:MAG: NAD-dependent epimerase/dehydratase family protein [Candidatus Zhuqueibacterota bacterium]
MTDCNNNLNGQKETVLVTGGAGFIGSHVIDNLIDLGYDVVCLDDLSGGFKENINQNAEFIEGSVVNSKLVDSLFDKFKFDYVFHLAAYAAEGLSHFIKRFNYTNNLIGSANLINASVNSSSVKCFVFTSSIAVYGENQLPMSEDTTPLPEDPYGIAKYAVELDLKETYKMFSLPYIIFRPHNVYGERQNIGDKYRNVVGIFMNQILHGNSLTIFGDGKQERAFSYIDDVAPIIAQSIRRREVYNKIFNVGADYPCSVNELAAEISKAFSVPLKVEYLESRNEVKLAYSSHEKVKKYFGDLTKNYTLGYGIKRMSDWVIKHGARETTKFENIEVMKNLPKSWR